MKHFKREAKEGWRLAAGAARVTDERASSDDRKHTLGGVFVAVDSNLGTVVGEEEVCSDISPRQRGWNHPGLGNCARVYAGIFGILLVLRRMDPEERSPAGGSFEASQSHQTSMASGV